MSLGPNIKAAIARIAQHLPHLRSEGTAMPPASKDEVQAIKMPLAGMPSSGPRDPLINCAEQWVEKLLLEAIDADSAPKPKVNDKPKEATTVHGGVTLEPQPEPEPDPEKETHGHGKKHHHKGGK